MFDTNATKEIQVGQILASLTSARRDLENAIRVKAEVGTKLRIAKNVRDQHEVNKLKEFATAIDPKKYGNNIDERKASARASQEQLWLKVEQLQDEAANAETDLTLADSTVNGAREELRLLQVLYNVSTAGVLG